MKGVRPIAVSSTQIRRISYSASAKRLEVEFQTGAVYEYEGVPQWVVDDMLTAESVGSYFHYNIRSDHRYPYRKLKGGHSG